MKALFIGGTGTISTEITKLCVAKGWDLTLLNRGQHKNLAPEGVKELICDIHNEADAAEKLKDQYYDVVAEFIAFTPEDVERDIRLFTGKTSQYMFISSASAYQKPHSAIWVTEGTPLCNPYWQYSRNKAACEDILVKAYRENGFPATIIRPSHTYCERSIPLNCHGRNGSFQVLERIRQGKKVLIAGDGLNLWTLTHSRDFAVAFEGLMNNPHALGQSFHITSDEALTWNQIYEIVAAALGQKAHIVHIATETMGMLCSDYIGSQLGDKSNVALFDNTKVKQAVPAYNATTRFDQGVEEAVKYIYSHPECQILDPEYDAWVDQVIEGYEKLTATLPKYEM